jgi:exonuclease VII large subunit
MDQEHSTFTVELDEVSRRVKQKREDAFEEKRKLEMDKLVKQYEEEQAKLKENEEFINKGVAKCLEEKTKRLMNEYINYIRNKNPLELSSTFDKVFHESVKDKHTFEYENVLRNLHKCVGENFNTNTGKFRYKQFVITMVIRDLDREAFLFECLYGVKCYIRISPNFTYDVYTIHIQE